ncbi:MAG: hypothetical protein KDC67_10250 [Ignavibacteriae bacterium]|nr:hypothetical protein [Ignavibacteriota bacterium]
MCFFIVSEVLARIFHISTDAPKTVKNERGFIDYVANQEGYWEGGKHKWYINKYGYPGKDEKLPSSFKNLITVIGDSYIENFMNPDSCRQAIFLKKIKADYNYFEMSRSGANLLDYLEYTKVMDTCKPIYNLLYVNTNDFKQSIRNLNSNVLSTQIDLVTEKMFYPKYQGSKLKDVLYN